MADAPPSLPLEAWLSYRFGIIASRIGQFAAPAYITRHGLTTTAWRTLAVIARHQPLSAKELGQFTSAEPVRVSRAIEALVSRKLISRKLDPKDKRRASLRLTAAGRRVYADIEGFALRIEATLTATLTAAEYAALHRTLDKIDECLATRVMTRPWQDFMRD